MADCIDRQDAIDAIWKVQITPGGELFNAIKRAQEELIKQLPAVDADERKRGLWITDELNLKGGIIVKLPTCSVCNCRSVTRYDFCPNCGAEMVGEACAEKAVNSQRHTET